MTAVQACLNGNRSRADHPAVPLAPDELAREAAAAVAAGASSLHVHPRDGTGAETLEPAGCAAAVRAIRAACPGVPVGLTTGLWIAGDDAERRLALVAAWEELPDFASVNVYEAGTSELGDLLLARGVEVEAGLATVDDARALASGPLAARCLRALVEVEDAEPAEAVAHAVRIDAALRQAGVATPQLHHGVEAATWAVVEAAAAAGHQVRVGLEDVLALPDGRRAEGNAELVAALSVPPAGRS